MIGITAQRLVRPAIMARTVTPLRSVIGCRTMFGASRASQPKETTEVHKQEVDVSAHPIFKRLPKFMHKYAANFANTPVSHVTSFMILHEATAIAPLFGMWYLFHSLDFVPPNLPEWLTTSGVDFVKVMAERNGWDFSTEEGTKWLVEGAAAYAIVKLLLPVRAALSLVLMPWFANTFVIPCTKIFRVFARKEKRTTSDKVWEDDLSEGVKRKEVEKPKDSDRPQL